MIQLIARLAPFLYLVCGISISAGMSLGVYPLAIVGMVGFPILMQYTKVVPN
jgi:hypothetical protein